MAVGVFARSAAHLRAAASHWTTLTVSGFLFSLLPLQALAGPPAAYPGRITGITDGDTVDVLISAETAMALGMPRRKSPVEIRLRLAQIDTPEKSQPYGQKAKQGLADLVFGRNVIFTDEAVDDYDRTVSTIYLGEININREMVRQGFAWAYRRYGRDPALCILEDEARKARRGLWGLQRDQVIAPWEFRSRQRKRSEGPFTDFSKESAVSCIATMSNRVT